MSSNKSLFTATAAQILTLGCLIVVLYTQSVDTAKTYARLAELSANDHSSQLVLDSRNDTQHQFSVEREDMKRYVNETVDRKIAQFKHNQN